VHIHLENKADLFSWPEWAKELASLSIRTGVKKDAKTWKAQINEWEKQGATFWTMVFGDVFRYFAVTRAVTPHEIVVEFEMAEDGYENLTDEVLKARKQNPQTPQTQSPSVSV